MLPWLHPAACMKCDGGQSGELLSAAGQSASQLQHAMGAQRSSAAGRLAAAATLAAAASRERTGIGVPALTCGNQELQLQRVR